MPKWRDGSKNVTVPDLAAELSRMKEAVETGDESALTDAFFQNLSFGTAGLRGTLGAGTNRMNVYTVGRATQGFADYLNAHFENPSVAIARDSRKTVSSSCARRRQSLRQMACTHTCIRAFPLFPRFRGRCAIWAARAAYA